MPLPTSTDEPARLADAAHGRQLRVVLACDSTEPSGVGMHMLLLATVLSDRLWPLLVFSRDRGASPWARQAMAAGIEGVTLPAACLREGGAAFTGLLQECRPDVVHVHAGIGWEGHGLARAARRAAVPAVIRSEHLPYTLRVLKNPGLECRYAAGAAHADRIICVSDAGRATFRMSGLAPDRFTTVHNGIVPRRCERTRDEVRSLLGVGQSPLIITVARLTEQKRHDVLLHAFSRLLWRQPDARLLLVGSGPLGTTLQRLAAGLQVDRQVHFLGQRQDVPDLLAAADLFCLPSYFEGHPLVLMEAMAAGLPIVASRSLGITETVSNGETGILVPFNDSTALAAAMGRLLTDRPLARRLGSAGQRMVHERFGAERMAGRVLAIYRDTLALKPRWRQIPATPAEATR